jgi:hypothetical protein
MASFLVEAYTAAHEVAELDARARAAAEELAHAGRAVRHVRTIFVPEDEMCFHLFEAASVEVVREASERARLSPQRIVETVT